MKILIAAVSQSAHLSGITRHAANMARCLLTRTDVSDVYMVVGSWQETSIRAAVNDVDPRLHIHQVSLTNSLAGRILWYWNDLPALAAELGADIVHLACPVPVKRSVPERPMVVTLHDLYPFDIPANFGAPLKVLFNQMVLQQCLRAVDAIACVSESTAFRLGSYTPKRVQERAVTVYNCVEPGPSMAAKGPLPDGDAGPFLLCVAQHRRNKNVVFAMRVFQQLILQGVIGPTAQMVVVGIEGPETPLIHRFIRESGLSSRIVLLRGISDAELQWCYGHCQLLLAPSIVEGFGLPIVEAMLHGCRVVCSDIPAFREVGGTYCHYASLEGSQAEEAFVDATRRALESAPQPDTGTERFSGPRVGEAYLQLYTRLRNGRSNLANQRLGEASATTVERVRS
jgi:glycosyltransferase involved in cell wall biosynthesis